MTLTHQGIRFILFFITTVLINWFLPKHMQIFKKDWHILQQRAYPFMVLIGNPFI